MMPLYKICVRFTLSMYVFLWFSHVWHSLPRPVDCVAVRERRNYHILFLTPIPVGSNCSRTCTTMFICCLFIFLHISVWPYTCTGAPFPRKVNRWYFIFSLKHAENKHFAQYKSCFILRSKNLCNFRTQSAHYLFRYTRFVCKVPNN